MFAEKLDFLMKLTGARNSGIGRAAHVDASTVSRLRSGKRGLPKQQTFLPLMCAYFRRNILTSYQQRSAADAVCPGQAWPQERQQAEKLLLAWLTEEKPVEKASADGLMPKKARFSFIETEYSGESELVPHSAAGDAYYIGNQGKREAVIRFLSAVAAADSPRTLLLSSDESTDWLNEDASFARQWAALTREVVIHGNRIRIVHTVGRTLDEMLQALEKWLGVYRTGAVEPYYCPKLRDGIARRTLFIAPGLAAVCASSVGAGTQGALNLYTSNAPAVQALEAEFASYFALCVPLMRVFTKNEIKAAQDLLCELLEAKGDAVIVQSSPSFATLPSKIARRMLTRGGNEERLKALQKTQAALQKSFDGQCVYESFVLAEPSAFQEGAVAAVAFGGLCGGELTYTKAEYAAHLAGVLDMLEKQENYHVCLLPAPFLPEHMALYHKPRTGTVITCTDDPPVAFAINEDRITAAFHEYLMLQMENMKTPGYRKAVMERLSAAVYALRNA